MKIDARDKQVQGTKVFKMTMKVKKEGLVDNREITPKTWAQFQA